MMQRIGLLGGTFNPIHFGHLRMAQEIAQALTLHEVRFIPSANPPHKTAPAVSAQHRAQMVQLAIENNPLFKLDTRELNRAGASYTIDTLYSIRQEIGLSASLCLIMGTDAFSNLDTWHRWREILGYCHIILVQRRINALSQPPLNKDLELLLKNNYSEHADDLFNNAGGFIHMQSITELDISSTAIRKSFMQQQLPRYLMPQMVIDYILTNQLYN
jgi:nicotinate-nucleotide adenylyltransferase